MKKEKFGWIKRTVSGEGDKDEAERAKGEAEGHDGDGVEKNATAADAVDEEKGETGHEEVG